mmetsp:Transcript_12147/g.32576  ORF Transcript_12147/g.32576 Transcript_12147/m.32576 type:complete len:216 (+) Transcript_12147:244-891(+)
MDFVVVALGKIPQAVRLVPTGREAVERDLASDRVREVQVRKLLPHLRHHGFPDVVREVELFELVSLLATAIPANGREVEHALSELNEGTSLDRDVQIGNVVQRPVNHPLQVGLTQVPNKAGLTNLHTVLVREQAILGKAVVEHVRAISQLLLLFDKVRASDDTNADLLSKGLQVLDGLGGDHLTRLSEGAVDIEQHDDPLILPSHCTRVWAEAAL